MQVTEVTVTYQETVSLPNYCNSKAGLTLTATIESGDGMMDTVERLTKQVTDYVHDRIDDALEAADQSPKYYSGPLYRLYRWGQAHALVILPEHTNVSRLPGDWRDTGQCAQRKAAVTEQAYRKANDAEAVWQYDEQDVLDWWNSRKWYTYLRFKTKLTEPLAVLVLPIEMVETALSLSDAVRQPFINRLTGAALTDLLDDLHEGFGPDEITVVHNHDELVAALSVDVASSATEPCDDCEDRAVPGLGRNDI